jgi:hypothetical protein
MLTANYIPAYPSHEKKVEILQASALENLTWPKDEPRLFPQRIRPRSDSDLNIITDSMRSAKLDMVNFAKDAKKENLSLGEQILKLLSHEKFQMNGTTRVRNEAKWKNFIDYSVSKGEPIDIVYPQFCVIPNAPKRYTNTGYTAGEDCTIEFFKQINNHVKEIYPPGIRLHALADASLYASAFQTPQNEVIEYYNSLQNRIKELKADDCVFLYDYADLLRTTCHQDYRNLYHHYSQKVWAGDVHQLIPNTDINTLWRSVRCSVNTRRFQLSHEDLLSLFGPIEYRNPDNPYSNILDNLTDSAFREVVSIRLACTEIDIASRKWPHALRASCHKGIKNGHFPIGLKVYPEYFNSCRFLPYHGMPLICKSTKGKIKLVICPEVLLRGRNDLIRITIGNTEEVYAYIDAEVDGEYNGNIKYTVPA